MLKSIEAAIEFVNNGGACYYKHRWSGALQPRSTEWAKEQLANNCWHFGMGFYELRWGRMEYQCGEKQVLIFNEFEELDLY